MATYIMLSNLTDAGRVTLKERPERLHEVNKEIEAIALAIGVDHHTRDAAVDLSGLRYKRINILADADVDGAHITAEFLSHTHSGYNIIYKGHKLKVLTYTPEQFEFVSVMPPPSDTTSLKEFLAPMPGSVIEISVKAGEAALLPAVRAADEHTMIIASGYSCREQIAQLTDRNALHIAEVVALALTRAGRIAA